jgi:cytochrome c5
MTTGRSEVLARAVAALLAGVMLIPLCGCGASGTAGKDASSASNEAQSVSEPFTHQQQLVEQGGHLVVAYGCASCHLAKANHDIGPSFANFAGHDVTLADGRRVLVDEHFLREGLLHPERDPVAGYDPAPMITALRRLHLNSQPQQVAALTAFIEQIGPEPG